MPGWTLYIGCKAGTRTPNFRLTIGRVANYATLHWLRDQGSNSELVDQNHACCQLHHPSKPVHAGFRYGSHDGFGTLPRATHTFPFGMCGSKSSDHPSTDSGMSAFVWLHGSHAATTFSHR